MQSQVVKEPMIVSVDKVRKPKVTKLPNPSEPADAPCSPMCKRTVLLSECQLQYFVDLSVDVLARMFLIARAAPVFFVCFTLVALLAVMVVVADDAGIAGVSVFQALLGTAKKVG